MQFRTSSRCTSTSDQDGNCGCVEVAINPNTVVLRDLEGSTVTYSHQEWEDFLPGVKAGEFDLTTGSTPVSG